MDQITWDDKDSELPDSDPRKNWRVVDILELKTKFNGNVVEAETELGASSSHIARTDNPHNVTKTQLGLDQVNNTSDINKPVSTDQAAAINAKVADSIVDNVTTIAPSQNAVFDALALKANASAAVLFTDVVWGEIPTGTINDINTVFTIANSNPRKIAVYSDGTRVNTSGFSVTGTTLTMVVPPNNSLQIDCIK